MHVVPKVICLQIVDQIQNTDDVDRQPLFRQRRKRRLLDQDVVERAAVGRTVRRQEAGRWRSITTRLVIRDQHLGEQSPHEEQTVPSGSVRLGLGAESASANPPDPE